LATADVHLFAVTRGSHDNCRAFFGNKGTGSLLIDTGLNGEEQHTIPFRIGHVLPERGFIHVLDELTLEVLIHELDTISDFVAYIAKKESLLGDEKRIIMATGEEQLVAMYLSNLNQNQEHDFIDIPTDVDGVMIDESHWESFVNKPQYIAKKKADEVSYVWDKLIEHFTKYIVTAQLDFSQSPDISHHEQAIRVMAAEPRIRRRQLGEALIDALDKNLEGRKFARLVLSNDLPDTAYVFLILPVPDGVDYQEYRQYRRALLMQYCTVVKLEAPNAKQIFGFSTEPLDKGKKGKGSSEDIILMPVDDTEWTPEREEEARQIQKEFRIFLKENVKTRSSTDYEFPKLKKKPNKSSFASSSERPHLNRAQRRAMGRKKKR
jgi:hypothetical protein